MPQDIRVARPFMLIGSDGKRYAYGIGLYPQVSDEIASLDFVTWHCEDAVLSRGAWLAQKRNVVPPGAQRIPQFIWLRPENSNRFATTIEAGFAPSFQDGVDIQFFQRLDCPQPDAVQVGADPVTGEKFWRLLQSPTELRNQPLPSLDLIGVVRVYPGDPSPPVRSTGDPLHRDRGEVAAFAMTQRAVAAAQAQQAARMAAPPASTAQPRVLAPPTAGRVPATPVPKPMDWSRWTYIDPRQVAPVAAPPQPGPAITTKTPAQVVPLHAVYEERVRARLERRALQQWAA